MNIFEEVSKHASENNLRFLVIGGQALNAYEVSRETFDVDFLVQRKDVPRWTKILESLQFKVPPASELPFLQCSPISPGWPVDLMLVNEQTFEKLWAESRQFPYQAVNLRFPSPEHLIALKLHALRQEVKRRALKDFLDVVELVETQKIDLHSPIMKDIFAKYATPDLHHRLLVGCDQPEAKNK